MSIVTRPPLLFNVEGLFERSKIYFSYSLALIVCVCALILFVYKQEGSQGGDELLGAYSSSSSSSSSSVKVSGARWKSPYLTFFTLILSHLGKLT